MTATDRQRPRAAPTTGPPDTTRRGRPPKGARHLNAEAILDATLALIDAEGLAAVSMRTVARRLGVDAKSLYNHIDGIDGLLDAVAEHILSGMRFPEPTDSPVEDLRAFARVFRTHTLAHPNAATLVLTRRVDSVPGLVPVEAALSAIRRAGCSSEQAVHLLRTFLATLIGSLLREVGATPSAGAGGSASGVHARTALELSDLPAVVEAAPYLARFDPGEEFEFALDAMVRTVSASRTGGRVRGQGRGRGQRA